MDAEEKLTALKKAYADIILNTAKEAAARIMVSERKSVRLQHELNVSKEQAIQMLLRIKQMMDSKISEAETTSLSQQRKIETLEAQLQEAEDIVRDLREELREVHAELERARNNKPKEMKSEIISTPAHMMKSALDQINDVYSDQEDSDGLQSDEHIVKSDVAPILEENRPSDVALEDEANKSVLENGFHSGNFCRSEPNIPSIILRNKGPEPYRNRRTQRIRAFEEKLMAGELTFSDNNGDVNLETSGKEDVRMEGTHRMLGAKATDRVKDAMPAVQRVKCLKRKRRSKRYKKKNLPLPGHLSDQALDSDRTSDISSRELKSDNNDDAEPDENPLDLLSRLSEDMLDEGTLVKCTGIPENGGVPKSACFESGYMHVEKADGMAVVRSQEPISGPVCGLSKQPTADRVFKYTFQRRKKQSVGRVELNASVENESMNVKEEETQNDNMVAAKCTSEAESSRDSRRVAQVARQLISLSERKWWQ